MCSFISFLKPDEQLVLESPSSISVVNGPQVAWFVPVINSSHKRKALQLEEQQYAKIKDKLTGKMSVIAGPTLHFMGPYDEHVGTHDKIVLLNHQYARLIDTATGDVRVEKGEQTIVPGPFEHVAAKADAVYVDDETAVLVLSKESGQQRLVTHKGLFFPGKHDEIQEVRKLIRVEPHEVAIARDNAGKYHFYSGMLGMGDEKTNGDDPSDATGTTFFLRPHEELVTMLWSSGTSPEDLQANVVRNAKAVAFKVPVTKIDMRPQYAFFEYVVRTSDNVELVLEGTIFWQVSDVATMIERTGDPKGDVWYHARSALIQAVSKVTLETFMQSFNAIVLEAAATDKAFYDARGVVLHNLEVVRYEPKDAETGRTLQAIIQETTNHINRMQQQRSENEVEKERVTALIDIEKQKAGLIKERTANEKLEASVAGEAEGTKLAQSTLAFMEKLKQSIDDEGKRVALLKFFAEQKTEMAKANRYASNPQLTTVIEGGGTAGDAAATGAVQIKAVPEMRVEM